MNVYRFGLKIRVTPIQDYILDIPSHYSYMKIVYCINGSFGILFTINSKSKLAIPVITFYQASICITCYLRFLFHLASSVDLTSHDYFHI